VSEAIVFLIMANLFQWVALIIVMGRLRNLEDRERQPDKPWPHA